jgi:hypothetical protein
MCFFFDNCIQASKLSTQVFSIHCVCLFIAAFTLLLFVKRFYGHTDRIYKLDENDLFIFSVSEDKTIKKIKKENMLEVASYEGEHIWINVNGLCFRNIYTS